MTPLFFIVLALFAMILSKLLWWYFPCVRRPWAPLLKARRRFFSRYKKITFSNPWIEIRKSKRQLLLYDGDRIVKEHEVALGTDAVHPKKRAGDGCTPEGNFCICTKNDKSRYHLFLGLNYPLRQDAERGRDKGLIDQKEYEEIINSIASGERPPWDTKLGGEIGIHGGGIGTDWTEGGIAMRDVDIEELFLLAEIGWLVQVVP